MGPGDMHPILAGYRKALERENLPTGSVLVEEFPRTYTEVHIFVASRHDYHRLCRVLDRVAEEEPQVVPDSLRMQPVLRGISLVWFGEEDLVIGFAARQQAQNFCQYARQWVLPKTGLMAHAKQQGIVPPEDAG